jgi:Polysaccharide pyruvyl transferase
MRGLNLFLAFDFFGAGNLGDDLMLAGLLRGLEELGHRVGDDAARGDAQPRIIGVSAHDLPSQARRFPSIQWLAPVEACQHWESHDPGAWAWVGVGGTPFQVLSGPWMAQFLTEQSVMWSRFARRVMIGIGAEREAADDAAVYAPLARQMDLIVTRDDATAELLRTKFDVWPDRVLAAADLGHLAFPLAFPLEPPRAFPMSIDRPRTHGLGVIAASYTLARHEVEALGEWIRDRSVDRIADSRRVAWLVNDVRLAQGMERHALGVLADRFGSDWRARVRLCVPPYEDGTITELLEPTASCQTVLSARYHGLLASAWLGARVAGFGGASKVSALARDLGVPMLDSPISAQGLVQLEREACVVPRERLQALQTKARAGLARGLE